MSQTAIEEARRLSNSADLNARISKFIEDRSLAGSFIIGIGSGIVTYLASEYFFQSDSSLLYAGIAAAATGLGSYLLAPQASNFFQKKMLDNCFALQDLKERHAISISDIKGDCNL